MCVESVPYATMTLLSLMDKRVRVKHIVRVYLPLLTVEGALWYHDNVHAATWLMTFLLAPEEFHSIHMPCGSSIGWW